MTDKNKRRLICLITPERCPYCQRVIKTFCPCCSKCEARLPDETLVTYIDTKVSVFSAVPYEGNYAEAIKRIKFRGRKRYVFQIAPVIYKAATRKIRFASFDLITFVPFHPLDYKSRRYNQSELIAEELSGLSELSCLPVLAKKKQTKRQHTLTLKERETNLINVFKVSDKKLIKGKRILLVDDIVTSGNTLKECSRTLLKAGAEEVMCITFAKTL